MTATAPRRPYPRWVLPIPQFLLRFDDEVYRAQRYDMPLSLVVAHVPARARDADDRFLEFAATLRRIDVVTTPRAGLQVICLPHTRRAAADEVGTRLRDALPEAFVGVVVFPEHGTTAHQLLRSARNLRTMAVAQRSAMDAVGAA